MATNSNKLLGRLELGLDLLKNNATEANKILASISMKKMNLSIMDEATKTKNLEAIKLIKKQIESVTNVGIDTTKIKLAMDKLITSFNAIKLNGNTVSETFKTNSKEAQKWASEGVKAATKITDAYNKAGQKIKETSKIVPGGTTPIASTKIVTNQSSAELNKIALAYQRLNLEGKTSTQSLNGMAREIEKVSSKYNLQSTALISANSQQMKYRTEADRLTQTQARQASIVNAEAQARIAANNKIIASNQKRELAVLAMYTKETSSLAKYDKLSRTLAAASGEAGLAMSSSSSGNSMGDRFKVSGVYALAAQSIFMLRQGIRNLIDTNRQYESSIVDLGRVLGDVSKKELELFGEQAIKNAKEYGLSLDEIQNSYTALAKAGVGKGDLNSMVNTIALGLNTSNITSGQQMAELLTTSMKQMDINFSESERLLDSWNYLADKTVADTSDFATAVSAAGATSASIGVGINELNGIVAVLSNSTGASGTSIGNAVKSMESRLLRPETLDTLKSYGIEVMADETHFKTFGEIITQVSDTLDKFGDNTVESTDILENLGGIMRKNWVNLLARDYDQVGIMSKQSEIESIGYSAKKSEASMDTLDKKVQVFNATVKEMYVGLGSGGLLPQLKGITEFGTGVVGLASKYSTFLFILLETAVAAKSLSFGLKMITGSNLTQSMDRMNLSFSMFGKSFNLGGATMATKAYETASKSLQAQILSGNITANESGAILGVLGTKLGMATTSTVTMSAAQGALDARLLAGSTLQASLDTQLASGSITRAQYNAEVLMRTYTEAELTAQLASHTITVEAYDLALLQRGTLEASLNSQVLAKTLTEAEAKAFLDTKIISETQYNILLAEQTAAMGVLTTTEKSKIASDQALNASQQSVASSALLMKVAIGLTVVVLAIVVSQVMKYIRSQKELSQTIESSATKLKTESDAIKSSLSDYEELANKASLTTAEKEKLITATQNLIKTIPGASAVINDETKSFKDQTEELKKLAAAKRLITSKEAMEDVVNKNYDSTQIDIRGYKSKISENEGIASGKGTDYQSAVRGLTSNKGKSKGISEDLAGTNVINSAIKNLEEYKTKLVEAEAQLLGMNAIMKEYTTDIGEQAGVKQNEIDLITEHTKVMGEEGKSLAGMISYSANAIFTLKELSTVNPYKAFTESMEKYNSSSTHTAEEIKSQSDSLNSFQVVANKLNLPSDQIELFTQFLNDEKNALSEVTKAAKTTSNSMELTTEQIATLNKSFDDSVGSIEAFSGYLKMMKEDGGLDTSSIQDILKNHKELIPYLDDEKVLYQKIAEAIANEKNVANETYAQIIGGDINFYKTKEFNDASYYKAKLKGNDFVTTQLQNAMSGVVDAEGKAYQVNLDNYKNACQAQIKLTEDMINSVTGGWAEASIAVNQKTGDLNSGYLTSLLANGSITLSMYDEMFAKAKSIKTTISMSNVNLKQLDQIDYTSGSYKGSDSKKSSGSGSSSSEKSANEALILKDRYYALNQELIKTQNLLDMNNSLQSDADSNNNIKEKIRLQKAEIELLKTQQSVQKKIEAEQTKERNETLKSLKSQGIKFNGTEAINAQIILQKKLDAVNAHRNDKDKTYYNKLKDSYEDFNTTLERFFTLQNTEIPKTKAEYQSLASEINKVTDSIKESTLEQINSILEKQKVSSEIALKQQQENEKNALASSVYGNGEKRTITVNTEIDKEELQKKYDDLDITVEAGAGKTGTNRKETLKMNEAVLESRIAEDVIKAYDKENERQQNAIQNQIDSLNEINDIQQEIETRLKNQNDLIEKQTALQEAKENKNIQSLTKNADGSFQFKYVADAKAIKSAQDAVDDQIKSNNDWEKSIALKHETDRLNALKQALADEKNTKDDAYAEQLEVLEEHQIIETNLMTLHYSDMNLLADNALKLLTKAYGDNWTTIIAQLTTDTATAKTLQDSLLLAQASGTLGSSIKGTTSKTGAITVNTEIDKAMLQAKYGSGVSITVSKGEGATGLNRDATLLLNEELLKKQGVIPKFDSGGEVGSWSGGSKLAMVDTKERVLSSTQTQDFGQLVTYLPNALTSIENIMDKISSSNVNSGGSVNHYNYSYGDLSFPNATNHVEIVQALDTINLRAKQYSTTKTYGLNS